MKYQSSINEYILNLSGSALKMFNQFLQRLNIRHGSAERPIKRFSLILIILNPKLRNMCYPIVVLCNWTTIATATQ